MKFDASSSLTNNSPKCRGNEGEKEQLYFNWNRNKKKSFLLMESSTNNYSMNLEISSSGEVYEIPADNGHRRRHDLLLVGICLLV